MAQFDVYKNPSQKTYHLFPYLLEIQSPVISDIATRIVVPLGKQQLFKSRSMKGLTPEIEYEGDKLLLLIPQISSTPSKMLKNPVGSLSHFRDEIVAAVNFAIAGF